MPISNQSNYIPMMQQFLQHWTIANNSLTPDSIKLEGGYTNTNFAADITALQTAFTNYTNTQATLNGLRNDAHTQRKNMIRRVEQFRKAVLAAMPTSNYVAMLPKAPNIAAIDTRFTQPLDTMLSIWQQINIAPPPGFTGPLKLEGGYLLATFTIDLTALKTALSALGNARINARKSLKTRNALFTPDKQRMKQYRAAIQATFKRTDSIYTSLPRLSPVPGSTPRPVSSVLAFYTETTNTLKITFDPSTSKNIMQYALYFCPDAKWNVTNTELVATNLNTPPFQFQFVYNQVDVNKTGLFKVYVTNETGNERGSHVLKVKRTAAQTLTSLTDSETTLALAA